MPSGITARSEAVGIPPNLGQRGPAQGVVSPSRSLDIPSTRSLEDAGGDRRREFKHDERPAGRASNDKDPGPRIADTVAAAISKEDAARVSIRELGELQRSNAEAA
jgi:hypothetical protein